jgi:hypothetical protein
MRRSLRLLIGAIVVVLSVTTAGPAFAGSPHFVSNTLSATVSADGTTLTVSGKEAGLGDETQVHIVVTATAECLNGGGNHPKAVNKASFSDEADEPVQNGKAEFSFDLVATFQPSCSPPMTVRWSDVTVEDTTNGVGPVSIRIS